MVDDSKGSDARELRFTDAGPVILPVAWQACPRGWADVAIDAALLRRPPSGLGVACWWTGGPIVGRSSVPRSMDGDFDGRLMLGAVPHTACATRARLPAGALEPIDGLDPWAAVIAAGPGLRALYALEAAKSLGKRRIVVLGASGPTGCLLGQLAREAGFVSIGVTTNPLAVPVLSSAGYHEVEIMGSPEIETVEVPHPLATVIDCRPDFVPGPHRWENTKVISFAQPSGRVRTDSRVDPWRINPVRAALEAPRQVLDDVWRIATALASGGLSVPTTTVALDEVPGFIERNPNGAVGAVLIVTGDPERGRTSEPLSAR